MNKGTFIIKGVTPIHLGDWVAREVSPCKNDKGEICFPGLNLKATLCSSAKKFKDPDDGRKSLHRRMRESIIVDPFLSPFLHNDKPIKEASAERTIVKVNHTCIYRAHWVIKDWKLKFEIYSQGLPMESVYDVLCYAASHKGIGCHRPEFGRFTIDRAEFSKEDLPKEVAA